MRQWSILAVGAALPSPNPNFPKDIGWINDPNFQNLESWVQ
jgi:hypothetical protein